MSRLSIQDIRGSNEFRAVKELKFSGILEFVFENIRKRNIASFFYAASNIILLVFLIFYSLHLLKTELELKEYILFLSLGILAGSIIIIPFHEGFHAFAFLLAGARKIKFGMDLRQMIFYATAKNFVAGRKEFYMIAIMPFLIINISSIVLIPFSTHATVLILSSMLLLHNLMCIGDFAMIAYFMDQKDKEMYTFDDLDSMTAWFYEKISPEPKSIEKELANRR